MSAGLAWQNLFAAFAIGETMSFCLHCELQIRAILGRHCAESTFHRFPNYSARTEHGGRICRAELKGTTLKVKRLGSYQCVSHQGIGSASMRKDMQGQAVKIMSARDRRCQRCNIQLGRRSKFLLGPVPKDIHKCTELRRRIDLWARSARLLIRAEDQFRTRRNSRARKRTAPASKAKASRCREMTKDGA